jgi:Icc protein
MAWAGTGLVWTLSGGIPASRAFAKNTEQKIAKGSDFTFVQISDSHIGLDKPANPNVNATLQVAIDKIHAWPKNPIS